MDRVLTFRQFFRVLAGLAVGLSLYWLWVCFSPWLRLLEPPPSHTELAFGLLMPFWVGIPGFLGLYFGYQGLRKTDAATARGLVGSYGVFLVVLSASCLSSRIETFVTLSEAATLSLVYLALTVLATTAYWFTNRNFLRSLDHQCPPIRRSLSRLPISIIALQVWLATQHALQDLLSSEGVNDFPRDDAPFVVSILLGISVYKLGVWLFVEQKSTAEPRTAAERRSAPTAEPQRCRQPESQGQQTERQTVDGATWRSNGTTEEPAREWRESHE